MSFFLYLCLSIIVTGDCLPPWASGCGPSINRSGDTLVVADQVVRRLAAECAPAVGYCAGQP